MIILLLLQICIIVILLIALFFFLALIYDSVNSTAPFFPIKKRALPLIVKALQLSPECVFYDLGCGDGRVLSACAKSVKNISAVGIERGIIPFFVSCFQTRGSNINIKRKDLFKTNLETATHIFCYLSDSAMEKLAGKFRDECKAGTRIVSCDFQLPNWEPKEVISIAMENDKFARNLFVYIKD